MKSSKHKRGSAVAAVAAPPPTPFWPYAVCAIVALSLVFEVYGPALYGPFVLDDSYLPYMQPEFAHAPLRFWLAGVRPLTMFSFWLNYLQSGNQNTYPYHAINVLLHSLSGFLVYLAVRKILSWANATKPALEILSVFAASLFLLHPLQTEAVSMVASRSETLSLFFVLAAFVVFLYRKASSVSFIVAFAIVLLLGAAVLSKEQAFALTGLLLLTDYFWNPGFNLEGVRRNWRLYSLLAFSGAIGGVFVWRLLARSTSAGFGVKGLTWYQYFFTQCRAVWVYLRLFLLPSGQNLDPDFPISRTLFDRGAVFGLAALVALIVLAWYYRRKFPLISYGFLSFLVLLAPTSSFVPLLDPLAERRLYLPFIGLLFVTVGLLLLWKTSPTVLVATLAIVLITEGAFTYQRNQLWASAIGIWQDSVANSPNKFRPRFQLAFARYQAGQCGEAVEEFGKAAQLGKADYGLLIDWALAYDCAGNTNMALTKLKEAAALQSTAHVYSQIGMEYAKQDKYPEAMDALGTAATIDPRFDMTYLYRGNIYSVRGDLQRAAEDYRRVLALNPDNQLAREALQRIAR